MFKGISHIARGRVNHVAMIGCAEIVGKAFPFFVSPILARIIGVYGFGAYNNYLMLVYLFVVLLSFGGDSNLTVKYFKLKKSSFIATVSAVLLLPIFAALAVVLVIFIAGNNIDSLGLGVGVGDVILALLSAVCVNFNGLCLALCQCRKDGKYFLGLSLLSPIVFSMSMYLMYVVNNSLDVFAVIYCHVFASVVVAVFSLNRFYALGLIDFVNVFGEFRGVIRFGLPLVLTTATGWFKLYYERYLLTTTMGVAFTGYYSAVFQFAQVALVLNTIFSRVYGPYLFSKLSLGRWSRNTLIGYSVLVSALFLVIGAVYAYFAGDLVVLLYGAEYGAYTIIAFPLCFAAFMNLSNTVFITYILFYEKTKIISMISLFSLVLHVVATSFFVSEKGFYGAGLGYLLSNSIMVLCTMSYAIFELGKHIKVGLKLDECR